MERPIQGDVPGTDASESSKHSPSFTWDATTSRAHPDRIDAMTRARDRLSPIMPFVLHHLQRGIDIAKSFFAMQGTERDAALASYIVRWHFRHALAQQAKALEIAGIEELGLSGISFLYPPYHLRVWKADEIHLGGLATSPTKQAFFAQQITFRELDDANDVSNLVILWDVDSRWNLATLRIGPPQVRNDQVGLAWLLAVQLPQPPAQ